MSAKIEKFMCLLPRCFYVDKIRPGKRTTSKRIASVYIRAFSFSPPSFTFVALVKIWRKIWENYPKFLNRLTTMRRSFCNDFTRYRNPTVIVAIFSFSLSSLNSRLTSLIPFKCIIIIRIYCMIKSNDE